MEMKSQEVANPLLTEKWCVVPVCDNANYRALGKAQELDSSSVETVHNSTFRQSRADNELQTNVTHNCTICQVSAIMHARVYRSVLFQ